MKMFISLLGVVFLLHSCSKVGEKAPAFSMKTISGDSINSADLLGKTIVLNVWATWCPSCIKEMPELNKLHKKYESDTALVFIALCDDDESKMKNILQRFDFDYLQVADAKKYTSKIQSRLVKTYPQNLILDDNFNIVFEVSDESENIFEAMDSKIQELKSGTN
ncbi:MAG: TlpA family protein disulfide reductase [Flavobacteriales bacterium]|nr:TlpA family protein disulfide reductase [Flavobacteriales bacterium]